MEIAIIEFIPSHGYEVWVTDIIEIGAGVGDVFDTRDEALKYAKEQAVPIADLTHIEMPYLEGEALRVFLQQYLDIASNGEIIYIKNPCP